MHTGAAWRELPAEYGAWQTGHSRDARWRFDGTRARILAALTPPPANEGIAGYVPPKRRYALAFSNDRASSAQSR